MRSRALIPFFMSALLAASASAFASNDPLVEGAKLCTRHLPVNEKKYGIPNNLLAAIASTESGRWHNGLNLALPWPWTINVEGQGYYYNSKQDAINAVRKWQARGVDSIDVGCMQVNLHHHPNAFASLNEAFDPPTNVDYAARFLRNNFDEEHSWRKAAANYHSRTPSLGGQYVGQVYNAWKRIIDRIRGVKGSYTGTYADNSSPVAPLASSPAPSYKMLKRDSKTGKMLSRMQTPHEFSLSVKNTSAVERSREGGVMVIRPAVAETKTETAAAEVPAPIDTASAAPVATAAVSASATPAAEAAAAAPAEATPAETVVQPKIRTIGKSTSHHAAPHTGPRFIFD